MEVFCFWLIIQYNREQRQILFNSTSTYMGRIFDVYSGTLDYLDLKADNEELTRENRVLQEYLQLLLGKKVETDSIRLDTLNTQYDFIPARIIKNSIVQLDNMITLDKGREDGIAEHMGVIGLDGLVGIVVDVSDHYSVAMSLLHRQTRISARLKSTPYFGSLVWKNELNPMVMNLEDIPKHASVTPGDTVETSGYSYMFPPGIPIGRIKRDSLPEGNNFFIIEVALMKDLSKAEHVYIVKNKDRQEILQLVESNE
jgi:rod shape-determining protein MreC